ncbi:MAG: MogA/MoaB family molybdenum cofactor biosynthesis protein [Synergistaceae bacterium]|nr:MogA/MoaB family molybdenum cofactor biosynthesis protein [Synergistaceae bacterium]
MAVITVSDTRYTGEREDKSGPLAQEVLADAGYSIVLCEVIPDERPQLAKRLAEICDGNEVELIVTTGGTGFSSRDWTPEATLDIAERQVPGIAEAMRTYSMTKNKRAMLSRSVSVLRGQTLIINLPGNPSAVREQLGYVLPALKHGLEVMTGRPWAHEPPPLPELKKQ